MGFYNLVPKPNNRWRSILDLRKKKQLFENTVFQNGDPSDNKDLPPGRGVGHLQRFQRRILPYTNKQSVQEIHGLSYPRLNLSIQSTTFWPVYSSHGVHSDSQRGQMASNEKGYKDPSVSRRLVGQSQVPPILPSTDTNLGNSLQRIGLASERGKIRAGTQTNLQFRRLPVQLERGQGQTHHRTLADLAGQDTGDLIQSSVSGPESNVPYRIIDCHRKAPTSRMVAGGKQCYHRSSITPSSTCTADLYRRIKRSVGRSLKRAYGKGKLVTPRKQTAYKLSIVKGSSYGIKIISSPLYKQCSSHSY